MTIAALINAKTNDTMGSPPPKRSVQEPEPAVTILILIIYRTLGGLLPARYQMDRRNLRYRFSFCTELFAAWHVPPTLNACDLFNE